MVAKTIVVSLPKPLPQGARVKGVFNTQDGFISKRPITSPSTASNILEFIKDEPHEIEIVEPKPPRKRQKLDHLSYEEKLMRR